MDNNEKTYANALNLVPEIGPIRLTKLLNHFGSYQKAWEGPVSELVSAGLEEKIAAALATKKLGIDPETEFELTQTAGIEILLKEEPAYPGLLKEIASAPPLLYIRGGKDALQGLSIAVVGTRKMTLYGKQATWDIASGLAASGLTIVSGLAFGVDSEALRAALEAGGYCVAVLASPVDDRSISPKTNFNLAMDIINRGCLVSEYPLNCPVQKQNFPVRNRVISGLSSGTLVIEADEQSGSLITAKYALEQNRLVFAVPGSIFSEVSRGTNALIKEGAVPCTAASDITRELNLDITVSIGDYEPATDSKEQEIFELIGREPVEIDALIRTSNKKAGEVNAVLAILEMKGRIKNIGGNRYVKVR